jgi:hypothetical protein
VIKQLAVLLLFNLLFGVCVQGQDTNSMRCVITIYRLKGERWKLIKDVEFLPSLQEEELTNKRVRLPGSRLNLFASVFPTDESMNSTNGVESLKLGLATSLRFRGNAFDLPNNAVAEGTLSGLDTLRVEKKLFAGRKPTLVRLECWDSELKKTRQ